MSQHENTDILYLFETAGGTDGSDLFAGCKTESNIQTEAEFKTELLLDFEFMSYCRTVQRL